MRQLHELLWYLSEALTLQPARSLQGALSSALEETERLTHLDPDSIMELDVAAHRADVNALLLRSSELVRTGVLISQKGAQGLRKTYGRGADLGAADFIGADFRDADLRGADLTESIFLTQAQINAAKGDARTKLCHP